jgi:hypothetical protein
MTADELVKGFVVIDEMPPSTMSGFPSFYRGGIATMGTSCWEVTDAEQT